MGRYDPELTAELFCQQINNIKLDTSNYEQMSDVIDLFCSSYSQGGAITDQIFRQITQLIYSLLDFQVTQNSGVR